MEKKVCFVASSGGHLEEISRLRKIESRYASFLVTEKSDFEVKDFCEKKYYIYQMNRRELLFLPKFIWLFVKAWRILRKEKPDYVITTGALVAYPFCVLAKLMKKKVIYIESFARVNHASLTGKLLYKFADLFLVQWEDMLELYPKSVLGGGIF
ncbi:MAG: polysaccharide biosynthesis protein [Lachnospiraceae bacterium]|nr:polysaccharide biosynthesis protein [Lachnospiraceae bacterium]